jgi:hypothetical protein
MVVMDIGGSFAGKLLGTACDEQSAIGKKCVAATEDISSR